MTAYVPTYLDTARGHVTVTAAELMQPCSSLTCMCLTGGACVQLVAGWRSGLQQLAWQLSDHAGGEVVRYQVDPCGRLWALS